jgi:acetyltransferase-like isoleucine patch superfamily enzyme
LLQKIKLFYWLCVTQTFFRFVYDSIGFKTIVCAPLSLRGKGINLGKNVRIAHMTRLETFNYYNGKRYCPRLTIGDNTSIEQCCHIAAVGNLQIGCNSVISSFVFIEDHEHSLEDLHLKTHLLKRPLVLKNVKIGRNVFIGSGAKILAGSQIGDRCVVGANAVVKGIFPDDCIIAGVPAKIIRQFEIK